MLQHLEELEQKRSAAAAAANGNGNGNGNGSGGRERTYSDVSAMGDGSLDLSDPITLNLDRTNTPDSRTHSSTGSADTSHIALVGHSDLSSSAQHTSGLGGAAGGFDGVGLTDHENPMSHDVEQHQKLGCCERTANVAKLIKSTHHCMCSVHSSTRPLCDRHCSVPIAHCLFIVV